MYQTNLSSFCLRFSFSFGFWFRHPIEIKHHKPIIMLNHKKATTKKNYMKIYTNQKMYAMWYKHFNNSIFLILYLFFFIFTIISGWVFCIFGVTTAVLSGVHNQNKRRRFHRIVRIEWLLVADVDTTAKTD